MFTGIIESMGEILDIVKKQNNITFTIKSNISSQLKIDQSVSHDGVCMTVIDVKNDTHKVTAIQETLNKSNLKNWEKNKKVNLERCMLANGRFDGHIVQGHVDCKVECVLTKDMKGSKQFTFKISENFSKNIVEKGSITINGISLTIFNVGKETFDVAIIPYTLEHTNIQFIEKGDSVNIEFDIVGKYILRINEIKN